MPSDQHVRASVATTSGYPHLKSSGWWMSHLKPRPGWIGWSRLVPFIRPVQHVAYIAAGLMPRNPKLWVFGCWGGLRFADNAAAMFRYSTNCARDDIAYVWITKDRGIRDDLRGQGYRAHMKWSISGLWLCLRAGVYVFDGLTKDINHWSSRGARRVLLRHGVGIKKIERAIEHPNHRLYRLFHGTWWQRLAWSFLIPWHCIRPDLVLASSKAHAEQAERFFGVPARAVVITGMPRNDALLSSEGQAGCPPELTSWIAAAGQANRSIALYIPTFRDDGSETFPYDWAEFDDMLVAADVNVVVKPHPADKSLSFDRISNLKHVVSVPAGTDTGALLLAVDCLVTDYSSIAYDFMLFRKPLVYFCPDLDGFQKQSRSFDVPYEDVTPGWHAHTLEELLNALVAATTGDSADRLGCPAAQYERVLARFHAFDDDNSCRRAHREIIQRFVQPAVGKHRDGNASIDSQKDSP